MSKMSQLHVELTEQANELGFETIEEAEACGYMVVYLEDKAELLPRDPLEQLNEAHEAWLKERDEVIAELMSVYNDIDVPKDCKQCIKHAIKFIKEQCHD